MNIEWAAYEAWLRVVNDGPPMTIQQAFCLGYEEAIRQWRQKERKENDPEHTTTE